MAGPFGQDSGVFGVLVAHDRVELCARCRVAAFDFFNEETDERARPAICDSQPFSYRV
jgi:hypothetical protein